MSSLHWRHNDHVGVSNHQPRGCLLNRLFRRRWKKTSKFGVTGLYAGNSPGPVNSPHKGPVTRKMFPFDDVIMIILLQEYMLMLSLYYIGTSPLKYDCSFLCLIIKNKRTIVFTVLNDVMSSLFGKNGRHFAEDIFRCIFVYEKFCVFIKVSMKSVP